MDPLSITVSVSSLIIVCTRIIKLSSDVSNAYRNASFVLSAIASECAVISASLTRLQNMLSNQLERLGPLAESLETALLGCALTMSVLQEQIGGLANETNDGQLKPKKFKYVLEQDYLKELLHQVRGQQVSITLLLQTYQSESLTKIEQSMQDYNIILQHMADRSLSLWRRAHTSEDFRVPIAIVGNSEADSVFELSSIITDTRFDFDDQVINSKAYRRALANLRQAQNYSRQLDINLNESQQTLDAFEGSGADNIDDEVASPKTEIISPSVSAPDILSEGRHELGIDISSSRKVSDDSAPTPSRGEETGDLTTGVVSDITVRPRPVLDKSEPSNPKDPQPQNVGQGTGSRIHNPDGQDIWPEGMSAGLEHNYFQSLPSHPRMENLQQGSGRELGEHATSLVPSSSLESSSTEVSKQVREAAATPSLKRSSWRFQRFFSGLLKPTSVPEIRQELVLEIRRNLVLVGDPCGKTALAVLFSKGFFPENNVPTTLENYVADVEVDGKYVELNLWDTSGLDDYDRLRPFSYIGAHVVIICYSVANKDSWHNVREKWISEVLHFCPGVPIILVGTQKDCRDSNGYYPWGNGVRVAPEDGEKLRKRIGAYKYLECSARLNEGVREVFETATRAAHLIQTKRKKRY
ncbi:uncharacterized protein DFL_003790 [Arthrobotrys flagrans]|uniref:Fungal N-terminal domain-containing protein n=1 Tax=Arthrobotrys flagrans TaxID=97331 RepID=A0A437A2V0_ARTFL|nr:hypothetical protein DFL_003790 [Arthrobotrys flagrans]